MPYDLHVSLKVELERNRSGLRSHTYDKLGRVLSEYNPESGYTYYTYDSVSGTNCTSSSPGDLVQKVDANGNTSCYHYDGLHRNTFITYSGPNSNGVNKFFIYDSATVGGQTMVNAEGRLAEAYTSTCSAPSPQCSKITDEGFSYSPRGKLADYYQSSPNSNGYYHLSATYWEDGQVERVSGLGLPALTYGGLDGEARVKTVTASSGFNPVNNVNYNNSNGTGEPIGALLGVTLGTGDSQSFTWDQYTGRMTSYSISVGASPQVISGALTWNANGTLQKLDISDAYNSADTQDCTYQYDDFMRAASVNCMNGSTNIWNQNFTYGSDEFGNLTKTVPTGGVGDSWPPAGGGYDPSTNHYTGIPGVTYDADGNLTNDTFHTYTWLADGHVASVSTAGSITTSIVYDAEGNKVEENSGTGGSLYEYVSAFGISAQMSGQTEVSADVNLPGGLQALYANGSLLRFRYPDWLGTIRAESDTSSRVFTESLAFAPFGERYAQKGVPFNVDSFTGKPDQIAGDEYDFKAREMHDGQGRWISPDPMSGTGNKYVYAGNNPLSNVDLYGLISVVLDGLEVGRVNEEDLTFGPPSESYSYMAASQHAAAQINFVCSALDCNAPGTDQMLASMGLIAPPQTRTAASQQQAQTSQSQQQGQPARAQQQTLSTRGLEFIGKHEGIKRKIGNRYYAYLDIYGNPTIGYGHLVKGGEHFSKGITKAQALALLKSDAQTAVSFVNKHLSGNISQTRFDAFVDVAFTSERAAGILIQRLNSSETIGPADFVSTLPHGYNSPTGLINRREDEANLFLNGDY